MPPSTPARVNQDPSKRTGNQTVTVQANGIESSVNLIGRFTAKSGNSYFNRSSSQPTPGISGSDDAVGAAVLVVNYSDSVTAKVNGGVKLYGDAVTVDAESTVQNVSEGQPGEQSKNYGFNGLVSNVTVIDTTVAQFAPGVQVAAGAGGVAVQANDKTQVYNIAADTVTSGNAGVGASVAATTIVRDTEAFVGDTYTTPANNTPLATSAPLAASSSTPRTRDSPPASPAPPRPRARHRRRPAR